MDDASFLQVSKAGLLSTQTGVGLSNIFTSLRVNVRDPVVPYADKWRVGFVKLFVFLIQPRQDLICLNWVILILVAHRLFQGFKVFVTELSVLLNKIRR